MPNAQPSPASERDRAIAARAIAEIRSTIPSLRETAGSILSRMGAAAASQENVLPPLEEAARISTLMIASAATGNRTLREAGLAAWDALVAPVPDETTLARALLPSRAKLGWALLPEQLAVLLEVLDDITRSDTQRGVQALHWARDLFSKDIVAAHVQLAKPAGVWQTDLLLPCIELAPVLATWFGAVPMPLP